MLRRGNNASAKFWRRVLLPVIERYRHLSISKFFRGDAAFADPALYRLLEEVDYRYAIRLKAGRPRAQSAGSMTMNEPHEEAGMREEYDFSHGVRGKHFREYREGHRVRIHKEDGTVEEHHFTLEDGAVMLDPDLRVRFPDSDAVNQALRSSISQG